MPLSEIPTCYFGERTHFVPEIIDWQEPPRRRRGSFFLLLAAILVVLFASRTALSYYVEALWFASLGYEKVFQKTLSLQWIAFAVFSATTFLIVYGWFLALRRLYEDNLPSGSTIFIGSQPVRLPVERILRLMALLARNLCEHSESLLVIAFRRTFP